MAAEAEEDGRRKLPWQQQPGQAYGSEPARRPSAPVISARRRLVAGTAD